MRGRTAVVSIVSILALTGTGCGGDQIAADEVTVDPPTLAIPKDTKLSTASRSSTADADATATATATADAAAGTTGATGATGTTGGTGAAAPAAPGTTGGTAGGTTTTPPAADTGGASADQDFDEFCANNPGAC